MLFLCLMLSFSFVYPDNRPADAGPYLSQKPPGLTPEIFAPGTVSTEGSELNAVISPDGNEFYFCRYGPSSPTRIMIIKRENGRWSKPRVAPFSGTAFSDVDPSISTDGNTMFFGSTRPNGKPDSKGCDIWTVKRSSPADQWSDPVILQGPVNTPENENYAFTSGQGTLFFQSNGHGGLGGLDIFKSEFKNGKFQKPENLGNAVNSEYNDYDAFIAPDESYIIFSSKDRPEGRGSGDLYISFKKRNGDWSNAKNMGGGVNSGVMDLCPVVTPDGKYLFFTSRRTGNGDIYWVSSKIIENFRPADHS